jgi:hypothetical protein
MRQAIDLRMQVEPKTRKTLKQDVWKLLGWATLLEVVYALLSVAQDSNRRRPADGATGAIID